MKLLIAIVQKRDANSLRTELVNNGFITTLVATTGGFLREGSSTFLIGVEPGDVDRVIEITRKTCKEREMMLPSMPTNLPAADMISSSCPTKVVVGGAVIFIVDAQKVKI